jgi:hypothetical protein
MFATYLMAAREAMGRLYCCDCLEVLEKQRKQAVAVLLAFAQTIEERDYRHDDLR